MYQWYDIFICGLFVIVFRILCTCGATYLSVECVIVFRITCTTGMTYLSVACLGHTTSTCYPEHNHKQDTYEYVTPLVHVILITITNRPQINMSHH
jgi:arginine exporter protein ArgO